MMSLMESTSEGNELPNLIKSRYIQVIIYLLLSVFDLICQTSISTDTTQLTF